MLLKKGTNPMIGSGNARSAERARATFMMKVGLRTNKNGLQARVGWIGVEARYSIA